MDLGHFPQVLNWVKDFHRTLLEDRYAGFDEPKLEKFFFERLYPGAGSRAKFAQRDEDFARLCSWEKRDRGTKVDHGTKRSY